MKLSITRHVQPSTLSQTCHVAPFRCCTITPSSANHKTLAKKWERLLDPVEHNGTSTGSTRLPHSSHPVKLANRWMEYQGVDNWTGLLDPLDENLRSEIIRYGKFVDATYKSFDFDPSSTSYGTCQFPKNSLLKQCGLSNTGYQITEHLFATSNIQLPRWLDNKMPTWMKTQSSWIGYVAICQDEKEITRLGRRDVVIALRGTVTCLEWLENLRATLTNIPNVEDGSGHKPEPMVEKGFLNLYTYGTKTCPSLQQTIRQEIYRLLKMYSHEPLSVTITGHSLGAALATLAANDINTMFKNHRPLVTVISFGGPRIGNTSFRRSIEKQGTKVLRIVNSDDVLTKVPGFDKDMVVDGDIDVSGLMPRWFQTRFNSTRRRRVNTEIGKELLLRSRDSPYLTDSINIATCHDLKTYLHLVDGFVSSTCPFRSSAKKIMDSHYI